MDTRLHGVLDDHRGADEDVGDPPGVVSSSSSVVGLEGMEKNGAGAGLQHIGDKSGENFSHREGFNWDRT